MSDSVSILGSSPLTDSEIANIAMQIYLSSPDVKNEYLQADKLTDVYIEIHKKLMQHVRPKGLPLS